MNGIRYATGNKHDFVTSHEWFNLVDMAVTTGISSRMSPGGIPQMAKEVLQVSTCTQLVPLRSDHPLLDLKPFLPRLIHTPPPPSTSAPRHLDASTTRRLDASTPRHLADTSPSARSHTSPTLPPLPPIPKAVEKDFIVTAYAFTQQVQAAFPTNSGKGEDQTQVEMVQSVIKCVI